MNAIPTTTPTEALPRPPQHGTRPPLAALGRVSLGAQIASAALSFVGGIILQVFTGHGVPLLIVAVLFAAGAALTAARFRWGPIPGALIGAFYLYFLIAGNPYPLAHLGHPRDMYPVFLGIVLGFGLTLLTFGASAAAAVQNYVAGGERSRPTWLTPAMSGLAGLVIGALLLGALAQPSTGASAATINGVPAVHLGTSTFDQTSITIPVGSRLIFADDAGIPHILTYGSWDASNHAHNAAQPAGAPALHNLSISSGTVETGPFTAAGTYHIYCLVHPGMNLTVKVQ